MAVMDLTIENELVKVVASCPRKYDSCTRLSCWTTRKLADLVSECHANSASVKAAFPHNGPSGQGWGLDDAGMVRTWSRKGRSSIWAFSHPRNHVSRMPPHR